MKRLPVRPGLVLALAFVALAAAMALWLGVFHQERAAAALEPDLVVTISPNPSVDTQVANGSVIDYEIVASNINNVDATDIAIRVEVVGGTLNVQAFPGTCLGFAGVTECTADILGNSSVTLAVDMQVTAASGSSVYLGAYVDPPFTDHPFGAERESEFVRADYGDDEALDCTLVGEDEDYSLTFDGVQLEPDNYDCTKHDVVAAAPSPSPTPAATRDFDLQLGWNNFVWTGADATPADTALGCIAGDFAIAYLLEAGGWLRYVPGDPGITTLATVDKYDSLLVQVTASGVQCLGMPVEP